MHHEFASTKPAVAPNDIEWAFTDGQPAIVAHIPDGEGNYTVTRKPFADKFRAVCEHEAATNSGWINPNVVRLALMDEPDYRPRQFSALWSSSWLVKTDREVQIRGEGSRGNSNKSTFFRRLAVTQ